jgi:hypothetical protein
MSSSAIEATEVTQLASYRRCLERMDLAWPGFRDRRRSRLRQGLFDAPVEKIAENIVEDLLTTVLDWSLEDVNFQIGRADIVLSCLGVKRMVLELKRPGSLVWRRSAVEHALCQAYGYADAQHISSVAISDGHLFYAEDRTPGGFHQRVLVDLDQPKPPAGLWWVSVHGIYRPAPPPDSGSPTLPEGGAEVVDALAAGQLLHAKYLLPASCFGYVGMTQVPHTWKLPYRLADGSPDTKRLPKAIQAILSNYRGARVSIPRESVPDVLVRLGRAAGELHKMPCQNGGHAADAYQEAHHALEQLVRVADVGCCE